jgi:hypothetical protein
MCEPLESSNGAKLGYEEVIVIMSETQDYRLLHYAREELKRRQSDRRNQLSLFSEPIRNLEDIT